MGVCLQIRMVGGRTDHEGRVEFQVKSRWGTICSDKWTTREAMVACRQLGLRYCLHAITVSKQGAIMGLADQASHLDWF